MISIVHSIVIVPLFFVLLWAQAQRIVGAPGFVQLDLFDSLQLHNSTYEGVTLGTGFHTNSPGVIFKGDFREIMVSSEWVDRVRGELVEIGVNSFTVSAFVKQTKNNVGTLLAFSRGQVSALEIQSSGRKNELRVISNSKVETFPFRLADGSWHRLAVSFSASQVDILVNCTLIYRRVLSFDPATALFDSRNISIWIGQRTTSNFLYQGVMQDLRLTIGPYGYLSQCPQMDTQCPTCSDYTALKMSFASLQSQIQLLTDRLNRAEARLAIVEECECPKPCRVNDTSVFNDSTTWNENCNICSCKKGQIECHPAECPRLNCTVPLAPRPGECCPTCPEQCWFKEKWYDQGKVTIGCAECECKNSSMSCKLRDPCPTLSCPVSDQLVVPGECCKVCRGTDYCGSQGSKCHRNATCINLQTTFTCQCNEGFSGDGLNSCSDFDECLSERNHCARNTICVNTEGGYECPCVPGFKQINRFQCDDEDECLSQESNKCHLHATCYNTKGSYMCACNPGYSGDGIHCSPICNQTCENGGICAAPDTCSCRSGWTGDQCETDINECLLEGKQNTSVSTVLGVAGTLCPENAKCINKPGWYLCQCRDGFKASLAQDRQASCQDIDECESKPCGEGLQCFNTVGSYECHCIPSDNNQCSTNTGCSERGKLHAINSKWFNGECSVCTCSSQGSTSCQSSSEEDCALLCPTHGNHTNVISNPCCDKCRSLVTLESTSNKKTCRHQKYPGLVHQSGEIWHSKCETCECENGEIDCWPIDCPPVKCRNPILPPGDCCHRCPEEKCTHKHHNSSFAECHLLENTIESGAQLTLPHHHCLSCKCQDGELCCTYDYNCVVHSTDDPLLTH